MIQMEQITQVLVFKTNIDADRKAHMLGLLRAQKFIHDVSIDVEDCDRVLRVVTDEVRDSAIIELVKAEGFFCDTLE